MCWDMAWGVSMYLLKFFRKYRRMVSMTCADMMTVALFVMFNFITVYVFFTETSVPKKHLFNIINLLITVIFKLNTQRILK